MSAHTLGPWIAANHGDYSDYDGNCIVVLGEGGDIRTAVVLGPNTEENRANASLIAAAPELLTACRQAEPVLADLERLLQARAPGFDGLAALQAVRQAIAKAAG